MIECFVLLLLVGLTTAQEWSGICPEVQDPPLPEAVFMTQIAFDCPNDLYGKIFYTCYGGRWNIMEECRCRYEVDEYGFTWWGVKVNKTEVVETASGTLKRFCKPSGWGNYDGSGASKCKGFGIYPDTPRGDVINMCAGVGTRQVMCDYAGKWVYTEGECYCPAEDGWNAVLENTFQERACGSNVEYRYCEASGVWGETDSSRCFCEGDDYFLPTPYGSVNSDNRCDNGVTVYRECSAEGVWGAITYSGLCECTAEPGWQDGLVGDVLLQTCSYGRVEMHCNDVGHWQIDVNDCACAADGVWEQSERGQTSEIVCGIGRMRRTCGSDGFWEEVQDFNCKCPRDGIWNETPAGEYARVGCSNGFMQRFCGEDGQWTEIYDRSTCYCTPQDGWQLTLIGETATKACPAGEQTRVCGEFGTWGEIDYSNCMCKAMDGFEATPVNTLATATCFDQDGVPDSTYVQTRFCGPDGEWGEIDQSQCPVKWCPSEQSWYKVPVGNRPTIVTIGCMSGERRRQCNVNGQWGPVDVEDCDCVYSLEDEIERLLRPGDSYSLACSVGERVYKCNEESGYFDPVDLSTCMCGTDGRFATTPAGNLASAACSEGTAIRICGLDGQWEEVDNSRCFCKGSDVWRQASVNTTVSILCDVGFRRRVCSPYGEWEEPEQDTCRCSSNGFEAAFGSSAYHQCDEGVIEYRCGSDGHFSEPIKDTCYCASRLEMDVIWNRAPAGGESAPLNCMNGAVITRRCNETTGHWEDLDASVCRCTTEGVWEETGVGEYAQAPCSGHATGLSRRQCHGSHWGLVDESTCYSECRYDAGTGEIIYVPVGETVDFPCYVNLAGVETYRCEYNEETNESVMVMVNSTCIRLNCPTDIPPYYVDAGDTETRPCMEGFTGNRTRVCQSNGEWSEYDTEDCHAIICPATTVDGIDFRVTLAGVYAEAACPEGYSGSRKLLCDLEGNWADEVIVNCTLNVCPAEDGWPETEALQNATIECPFGYTGMWTRLCTADGQWEPYVIPDTCIPNPPTVKSMPYEGMLHVSRTPSGSLFSSLAISNPDANCTVSIVSLSDPTEVFSLVVNQTKTALVGRYHNGGVFADFVLPEDDLFDPANYLRYGEYKMVFPSCWRALNGAPVPESELEVSFHTAPIPPSAPTRITLHYGSTSFNVAFEAPLYVDEAYPVTGYYLAFQPPVLPEVHVDASHRTFGPFPYFAGQVTLLLRAENAYGLSSPDVEVPYSFDDVLVDAADVLRISTSAPLLTLRRQVLEESGVSVTLAVAAPVELHDFIHYLEVTCNESPVVGFTSVEPVEYTMLAVAGQSFSATCYFTLAGTAGEPTTYTGIASVESTPYAAVGVEVEESEAQVLHLVWEKPAAFTAEPIDGYRVECRRETASDYPVAFTVTAEEATVGVSSLMPGPVVCRVAALNTVSQLQGAWGEAYVAKLHVVLPIDLSMTVETQGASLIVRLSVPYCVGATATVSNAAMSRSLKMTCETDAMTASFFGLEPSTSYDVVVSVPSLDVEATASVTTAAALPTTIGITVDQSLVSSSAAVVSVTTDQPETVYCVAHSNAISVDSLQKQAEAGLFDSLYEPAEPVIDHRVVLTDLKPQTTYHVSCVARSSRSVHQELYLFTTAAEVSPLQVIEVQSLHPLSHDPTFRLVFSDHVMVGEQAVASVMCGGLTVDAPLVLDESVMKHNEVRVTFSNLPSSTACSLFFPSLDVVRRSSFYEEGTSLLSETPFPVNESSYTFEVSSDSMQPSLVSLQLTQMSENHVLFATTTEFLQTEPFAYEVRCSRYGEDTAHRQFSTADHPMEVRMGALASRGYADVLLFVGLLPHLHTCQLLFPAAAIKDAYGNEVVCSLSGDQCMYEFVARAANPSEQSLELVSVFPEDGAQFVPVNTAVQFVFNRDVEVTKAISFRCLDCGVTIVSLTASCEQDTCVVENPNNWEAGHTYYIMFDATTFKAAWEDYYYIPSPRYPSFTTAETMCNMDYVTNGWDSNCDCINTGTHCQCNCGATAILKAF